MDDPDRGEAAQPDLASSWGGFQIWVDGINLCGHREEGERVESVYWYLLPLLEWFVEHWDPLLHEERLPCGSSAEPSGWRALRNSPVTPFAMDEATEDMRECEWQAWWTRHAITAAREGGIFPDIVFRRLRDMIEVSWGIGEPQGTPHYVSFDIRQPGTAALHPTEVAQPLYEILTGASGYLAEVAESTRLSSLKGAVGSLSRPRIQERLMWIAGLGVDARTVRRRWRGIRRQISERFSEEHRAMLLEPQGGSRLVIEGSCHAALMFGSLNPRVERDDVVALCDMAVGLTSDQANEGRWMAVSREEPVVAERAPWWQGYDLAERVHWELDGDFLDGDYVDVDELLRRLDVRISEIELTDPDIRGVAMTGPQHGPGVAWNRRSPFNLRQPGLRFTLAHELCHILFDHAVGSRLSVASGPWAPAGVERRANAFAAMLLMPTDLVQKAVGSLNEPVATEEGVGFLAQRLRTGFDATLRHLGNLQVIDDAARQRIEVQRQTRRDESSPSRAADA